MPDWKYLWPPYRRAQEREMQDELRSIAQIAGRSEAGNLTRAAEQARAVRGWAWLENLWRDARYAVRLLLRQPGFTAVTVLSLGLGIGANAAIFSLIDRVLWRQLPVRAPESLTGIGTDQSYATFLQYHDRFGEAFEGVFATTGSTERDLSTGGEPVAGRVELVTGEYFPVLGVPAAIGRTILPDDDARAHPATVAVLSYPYWQRAFGGDPAVLGRTLRVGKAPYQIVGVAAPEFFGVTVGEAPDAWLPLSTIAAATPGNGNALDNPNISFLAVMGRLRPGITIERASAMLTPLAVQIQLARAKNAPERIRKQIESSTLKLTPAAQGLSTLRARFSKPLQVLFAMVAIGLLLVCVNVMGLQMARADERRRELNVRLAIGAGRWRIVRQLMTESLAISAAGGALGLAICRPAAAAVLSLAGGSARLPIEIDPKVLFFIAGIAIASALICGLIPAIRVTGTASAGALQQGSRTFTGARRRGIGPTIAAVQLALSMVLIAAAFLFAFSLDRLTRYDTGIVRSHLAVIEIDSSEAGYKGPQSAALNRRLLERLAAMNGVESVTFSNNGIYSTRNGNTPVTTDSFQPEPGPNRGAFFDNVGPRFFSTLGTRIMAGRDFDVRDTPASQKVAIINQQFANYFFAGQNPIGRSIYVERPRGGTPETYQVAGVVQDILSDVRRAPRRAFYLPQMQTESNMRSISLVVRTRVDPRALAADFRALIRAEEPALRVDRIDTADALLNRTLSLDRLIATLAFAFGVLAVILAAVGIYGLLAYNVARRTGEIGIRMALGATRGRVISMVFREVVFIAAGGIAVGIAAAAALGRLVAGLVFGMTPGDPAVYTCAAALLAVVASGAAWIPARRASRLDPMAALRNE